MGSIQRQGNSLSSWSLWQTTIQAYASGHGKKPSDHLSTSEAFVCSFARPSALEPAHLSVDRYVYFSSEMESLLQKHHRVSMWKAESYEVREPRGRDWR